MAMTEVAAKKSFGHGVHPPEHKDATENKVVERLNFPPDVIVPLSQHIGSPAKTLVNKKQEVERGEIIAEANGFVSVPMHSPVKGTVTKVDITSVANGQMLEAIHIKTDPESDQELLNGPPRDINALAPKDIAGIVQTTGMVGLGGAAFPTHVKMMVPEGKSVDTVIANGCECEPYLTCDHRVMLEQKDDMFEGLRIALKATSAEKAIIGIEANKPDVIKELKASLPKDAPISVEAVQTKYPQGAEKILIKALLGREVPSGGLPSDIGAAVFNVATLAQIAQLIPHSLGLIERVITVTGSGVDRPGNYMIPLGSSVRYVLEQTGINDKARQVVMGGPMMGMSISSIDIPITKGVSGILVLTQEELDDRMRTEYACIKCGTCINACPLFLNPSRLGLLARAAQYEKMEEKYHLNDCFECGSCTYVCPSNIPLIQYFRIAKAINRERKATK